MMLSRLLIATVLGTMPIAATAAPPTIAAAVADPARPAEDRARDADRRPAEMLKFAGVKPGMTIVDMFPGGGYFTRLFADAVGPTGKVLAYVPDEMLAKSSKGLDRIKAATSGLPNVEVVHDPLMSPAPEGRFDIVWTSQNYHDIHNMTGIDVVAFDRMVLKSLKPGGVFVVLDHAGRPGTGLTETNTLHRIDPAIVKQELVAAGFVYDGETKVLANAADPKDRNVFDPSIRGHTDQFVYRFRKPRGGK